MDSYPLTTILRKQVLDIFKLDMQWFEELNELKTFMLCQMNSCFIKLYWLFLDTEIIECEYSYFSHVCTWYSKGKYICNISALKPVKTVTNLIKPHSLRDVLYFLSRVRSREPYFLKCFLSLMVQFSCKRIPQKTILYESLHIATTMKIKHWLQLHYTHIYFMCIYLPEIHSVIKFFYHVSDFLFFK